MLTDERAAIVSPDTLVERVRNRAAAVYGCDLTLPATRKVFLAIGDELAHSADVAETLEHEALGQALEALAMMFRRAGTP